VVWWLWLLFGLALLILEVQAFGSFYLMFFGVGALLVGFLGLAGVVETDWIEWVLFTALSVSSLALFRARLLKSVAGSTHGKVDSLVGETAVVVEDIPGGGVGKAELRGTVWNAQNGGPAVAPKGARCRVERVEGLTLWIRTA
jgi:membrane protein implicated in regulation of membrane protease activity